MAEDKHFPTLDEAQEQFLATLQTHSTADTYGWALKAFRRFIHERSVGGDKDADKPEAHPCPTDQLQDDVLEEYYYWLSEQYRSQQTTRTYLSAARRFLSWLDARELLADSFQLSKSQNRLKAAQGNRKSIPYKHKRVDPELPALVSFYDNLQVPEGEGRRTRIERLNIQLVVGAKEREPIAQLLSLRIGNLFLRHIHKTTWVFRPAGVACHDLHGRSLAEREHL